MNNRGDIDIDFADRTRALDGMSYVPASIIKDGKISRHNTGVYFHAAPIDPVTGFCSIDYADAERRGMFKIDMLNVSIYDMVRDEDHLISLMEKEMDWKVFEDREFVSKLFHLGNHADLTVKLKPRSIEHLAMILALIRPGKKHLQRACIERGFENISNRIWLPGEEDEYVFKKSHAVSYAMLVYVHANLLLETCKTDATVINTSEGNPNGY